MALTDNIKSALGEEKADLLLKNCKIVNTLSGIIEKNNVIIKGNKIVGIGKDYKASKTIDLKGAYLLPGLIDSHLHIESSMVTLSEYAKTVTAQGTTSIVIDPHEIANVMGLAGITFMLQSAKNLPMNVFVMLPSCVPATPFETSGAKLSANDLSIILASEWVIGLAEMMNFPGVIFRDEEVIEKILLAHKHDMPIDGHSPMLSGKQLCAYTASGIYSDHECTNHKEALEKLNRGMYIMVREGTTEKNLEELIKIISPVNSRRFLFATDDRHPHELIDEGHIIYLIKKAVKLGLDPIIAIQMATINPVEHFKIKRLGAVAPGYFADLVAVDSLKKFNPILTIKNGQVVSKNGKIQKKLFPDNKVTLRSSVNVKWLHQEKIKIKATEKKIKVIQIIPNQIITKKVIKPANIVDGYYESDIKNDILKIVVVERHQATGNVGIGFVSGFGLKKGALAASVAHDSHNIIAVGCDDESIYNAIVRIIKMQGGISVVEKTKILQELELPIAGLMSDKTMEFVKDKITLLNKASYKLGGALKEPLMALSFLALPVIPELKITDKGLFDVTKFNFTELGEK